LHADEELKHLTMPVLLLAGEKDALLDSKKSVGRAEKLISDVSIRLLENTGHVLINQADQILQFLVK
jgi:pimeloyl-ACP methyl ester carboxylesterase